MNDLESAHLNQLTEVETSAHQSELQSAEVAEDYSTKGTGVDGSGGSDTDTTRFDVIDALSKDFEDGQEQIRPNALKKSATFKPVSVTKSFLAKAGTVTNPTAKLGGDKGMLFAPIKNSYMAVKLMLNSQRCGWTVKFRNTIGATSQACCEICQRYPQFDTQSFDYGIQTRKRHWS